MLTALPVILAGALVSPLGFLVPNASRSPDMSRVVLVVGVSTGIGVLLVWVRAVLGSIGSGQGVDVASGIVVFTSFGTLWRWMPLSGWPYLALGLLSAIGLGLFVALASVRWSWTTSAFKWAIYVMALVPAAQLVAVAAPAQAMEPVPPVVVIFVDGYVAPSVLAEFGVDDAEQLFRMLDERGFIAREATASYSMTYASLASALEADYVATEADVVDGDFRQRMYAFMQGENDFVDAFTKAGYTYVHLESGWTGTRCGPRVDVCVPAPLLEETLWNLLQRTALRGVVVEQYGHAFTTGGMATLDWLTHLDNLPNERTLVISHVLLPHPPLFLDESCEADYSPYRLRASVWVPSMGESRRSERISSYVAQMRCVNFRLDQIAANPHLEDAVIAIVGDHGSDSQGQLLTPVKGWTKAMVDERMATIVAIRGCGSEVPPATVDTLAFIMHCAIDRPFTPLEPRTYLVPVEEVTPGAALLRFR